MSIKHTLNLDQFRFHDRNRRLNESHVKKLASSIQRIGLKNPIIVNTSGIVLDGQHRLEAIKLINKTAEKPVRLPYIKKNMKISDIAEMNGHQVQWRITDWIHYYAKSGNENYILLEEAAEIYSPIHINSLSAFLHDNTHGFAGASKTVTEGRFVYKMTPQKEAILDKLQELAKVDSMWCSKSALIGIMRLMRDPNFSHTRLFHAIELNFESILKQSGSGNWMKHLARWYNKGLRRGKLNINDLPSHH